MDRKYDLILLGATGYTGKLCVEYLAKTLPSDMKWAIAGRNKEKLEHVSKELLLPRAAARGTSISLDLSSEPKIQELARSTSVLINVIGPYAKTCGSMVFKACAENGTHYVDCSGESVWRFEMVKKYDDVARASRAKMVITCGCGSVPSDLSTYLAVSHIRKTYSAPTREVLGVLYDTEGSASGGAINTVLGQIADHGFSGIYAASTIDALSPLKPVGDPTSKGLLPAMNFFGVQRIDGLGALARHIQEIIDVPIIGRSWGLYAAGDDAYGPNFQFSFRIRLPNVFLAWLFHALFSTFTFLVTLSSVRSIVRWLVPPGTGPSAEQRRKNHFTCRAMGVADTNTVPRPRVMVEVAYSGDAHDFTAISMVEAALLLLEGDAGVHDRCGVLTPATLGLKYAERLRNQGVKISIDNM